MMRFIARGRDGSKYGKRHRPGEMNQTESRYASELQIRKLSGEIVEWFFEGVTLKLAPECRYTPDFMVMYPDGLIEFVDVKGGGPMDDKSRVKVKCAAEKFWMYRFVIAKAKLKRDGGGFVVEEF